MESQDNLQESLLSVHHLGPRESTQVLSLGVRCLSPINHHTGSAELTCEGAAMPVPRGYELLLPWCSRLDCPPFVHLFHSRCGDSHIGWLGWLLSTFSPSLASGWDRRTWALLIAVVFAFANHCSGTRSRNHARYHCQSEKKTKDVMTLKLGV